MKVPVFFNEEHQDDWKKSENYGTCIEAKQHLILQRAIISFWDFINTERCYLEVYLYLSGKISIYTGNIGTVQVIFQLHIDESGTGNVHKIDEFSRHIMEMLSKAQAFVLEDLWGKNVNIISAHNIHIH